MEQQFYASENAYRREQLLAVRREQELARAEAERQRVERARTRQAQADSESQVVPLA